jgi:hypothetical protein
MTQQDLDDWAERTNTKLRFVADVLDNDDRILNFRNVPGFECCRQPYFTLTERDAKHLASLIRECLI